MHFWPMYQDAKVASHQMPTDLHLCCGGAARHEGQHAACSESHNCKEKQRQHGIVAIVGLAESEPSVGRIATVSKNRTAASSSAPAGPEIIHNFCCHG